tara:strand:- start:9604 stop:9918 length:315 start_codon:yes stop_codon:yes gene_type:complete
MLRDEAIEYLKKNFKKTENISIATTFCCKDVEWCLINYKETHFSEYDVKKLTAKDKKNIIDSVEHRFDATVGTSWDTLLWLMVDYISKNKKKVSEKIIKINKEK